MSLMLPAPTAVAPTTGSALHSRARRLLAPSAVIGTLTVATLALRLRDPHQSGSWGLCPSAMVGIWCPGCGGLRAVNDLTHFQLVDAASSNLALVVALPVVVFFLARWALDCWTGRQRTAGFSQGTALLVLALVALGAFTVLRNLPGFTWLAP